MRFSECIFCAVFFKTNINIIVIVSQWLVFVLISISFPIRARNNWNFHYQFFFAKNRFFDCERALLFSFWWLIGIWYYYGVNWEIRCALWNFLIGFLKIHKLRFETQSTSSPSRFSLLSWPHVNISEPIHQPITSQFKSSSSLYFNVPIINCGLLFFYSAFTDRQLKQIQSVCMQ